MLISLIALLIVNLEMWNLCTSSIPSRKLAKVQRTKGKNICAFSNDKGENIHVAQSSPETKAIDDFESDMTWDAAWDTRKKVRIFYCSRVLRKLRRKGQHSIAS
jgi:hypothetical protein